MGQRLVITVKQDNKVVAGIYYHWSAYSISALSEAKELIDYLYAENEEEDEEPITDIRIKLIRYVEGNGGVINGGEGSPEWKRITAMYPDYEFVKDGSRNQGLIALTEEGIADLEQWSEGDIVIDLDNERLYNEVYCTTNFEEYNEWNEEEYTLEDIPEEDINIENMNFDEVESVIGALENLSDFCFRKGETIYEMIA